jgi:hypothetical protein
MDRQEFEQRMAEHFERELEQIDIDEQLADEAEDT